MNDNELLFPDLGLPTKKQKAPASGLLPFPAEYDTTPVIPEAELCTRCGAGHRGTDCYKLFEPKGQLKP